MKQRLRTISVNDHEPKTTHFLRTSQGVLETLFLILISIGMLYPYVPYGKINVLMDIAYFLILLIGGAIYLLVRKILNIKLASQDNVNLLRASVLIYFTIMAMIFIVIPVSQYLKYGILPRSSEPQPINMLETIGYLFSVPAVIAALLYPYLKLINVIENPERKTILTACFIGVILLLHVIFQERLLLLSGYIASNLPLMKNVKKYKSLISHALRKK